MPRSIFLDSKLRTDFAAAVYAPITYASLYGENLSQTSVSERVAGTIAASLTGVDAYDVLSRLLRNSTNVQVYTYVDITSYVLRANLPSDVVGILPWASVTNGPTGDMPKGFWDKISGAASAVVNSLVVVGQAVYRVGQLIYGGLVALGTFLVNLAVAIAK